MRGAWSGVSVAVRVSMSGVSNLGMVPPSSPSSPLLDRHALAPSPLAHPSSSPSSSCLVSPRVCWDVYEVREQFTTVDHVDSQKAEIDAETDCSTRHRFC